MMKKVMTIILAIAFLFMGNAYAQDDEAMLKLGVGYEAGIMGALNIDNLAVHNIVGRGWFDKFGFAANYAELQVDMQMPETSNIDVIQYGGSLMLAPIEKPNGKFFIGVMVSMFEVDVDGDSLDILTKGLFIGGEHTLHSLPEMGVYWRIGYSLSEDDIDDMDLEFQGTDGALGAVWYF